MNFNEKINELNKRIAEARKIIFFTGAGISTGSGIPDFRSSTGLYSHGNIKDKTPEYMLSFDCYFQHPTEFYDYIRTNMDVRQATPNIAHLKITELQKVKECHVITQNIDGLHEKAGNKNIYNIHGTFAKAQCQECGTYVNGDLVFETDNDKYGIPLCPYCTYEGTLKPDIVLYGEGMSQPDWTNAVHEATKGDLLIIVGTSLTVSPANFIPSYFGDKNIVIINKDETRLDHLADLIINDDIQKVFELIEVPKGEEE